MSTWLRAFALVVVVLAACSDGGSNNTCGDGETAGSEQCDDGNTSNGDGCSATCRTEASTRCGNNEVDVATETCDDGNNTNGDGCSAMCQSECGNGMLDGAEACDDGNLVAADGCSTVCLVDDGYTCTGEPSDCIKPTGACADPYVMTLTANGTMLTGMGTGDTTTSTNQTPEADCDGYPSGAGKDHIWQFTLTEPRDVAIEIDATTAFDSMLRVLSVPCDPTSEVKELVTEDGCSESGFGQEAEKLTYTAMQPGTYYVVIDTYDETDAGTYLFRVSASPTGCGNGAIGLVEVCDDGNTTNNDGCSASCDVELGYACTGAPSVCGSACGNGALNTGEECDDDNTTGGDRCSPTCTLEFDTAEVEPNNTTAQVVTASNHIIRGSLTANDVDLYTFTLAAPATVELETYDAIDNLPDYDGVGTIANIDCLSFDSEIFLFNATGDPTMEATAIGADDEDGDESCSYVGPLDSGDFSTPNPMQGVLPAGTYTIKVTNYFSSGTVDHYALDLKISSGPGPVAPVPGDLVLNEFIAGDNMSDTNCDAATTGTNDEFVEIVNVSTKVLDLTGLTIADSVATRHTFAAGTTGSMTLEPGKAVVVWAGGAPACAGVTNWFISSTGQLGFNDAGDTITIKDAAMVQLVQYVYPAATLNVSSNRSPDVVGTVYALHSSLTGAVGMFSPGKRANGTAF